MFFHNEACKLAFSSIILPPHLYHSHITFQRILAFPNKLIAITILFILSCAISLTVTEQALSSPSIMSNNHPFIPIYQEQQPLFHPYLPRAKTTLSTPSNKSNNHPFIPIYQEQQTPFHPHLIRAITTLSTISTTSNNHPFIPIYQEQHQPFHSHLINATTTFSSPSTTNNNHPFISIYHGRCGHLSNPCTTNIPTYHEQQTLFFIPTLHSFLRIFFFYSFE